MPLPTIKLMSRTVGDLTVIQIPGKVLRVLVSGVACGNPILGVKCMAEDFEDKGFNKNVVKLQIEASTPKSEVFYGLDLPNLMRLIEKTGVRFPQYAKIKIPPKCPTDGMGNYVLDDIGIYVAWVE